MRSPDHSCGRRAGRRSAATRRARHGLGWLLGCVGLLVLVHAPAPAGDGLAAPSSGDAPAPAGGPREIPLRVEQVQPLRFGRIAAGQGVVHTVAIDPASGRKTVRSGAMDLGGEHGPAVFVVRGRPAAEFTIVLPQRVELTGARDGVLTDFTSVPAGGGVIGAGGHATVRVGATLRFRPGQAAGDYAAYFSISAAYRE